MPTAIVSAVLVALAAACVPAKQSWDSAVARMWRPGSCRARREAVALEPAGVEPPDGPPPPPDLAGSLRRWVVHGEGEAEEEVDEDEAEPLVAAKEEGHGDGGGTR